MHATTIHAQESMAQFWDHYNAGHLNDCVDIMRGHGFTNETLDFVLEPASYYITERHNDAYISPPDANDDQIPIMAIEPGEYRFQKPTFHPIQIAKLGSIGIQGEAIASIEACFTQADMTVSPSGGDHGTASIYSRLQKLSENGIQIQTKPTMLLNVSPEPKAELTCPGVILHEMTHIAQVLEDPTYRQAKRLQHELEAYAVQAPLLHSYHIDYSLNTAAACTVDNFRKKFLGPTEFVPNQFFIEEFKKQPLFARILQSIET